MGRDGLTPPLSMCLVASDAGRSHSTSITPSPSSTPQPSADRPCSPAFLHQPTELTRCVGGGGQPEARTVPAMPPRSSVPALNSIHCPASLPSVEEQRPQRSNARKDLGGALPPRWCTATLMAPSMELTYVISLWLPMARSDSTAMSVGRH